MPNYQQRMEQELAAIATANTAPRLLLHSCCAPCSSYVLETLSRYFDITVFYDNPNIYPQTEFDKRVAEQQRLIEEMPLTRPVSLIVPAYDSDLFFDAVKGLETAPEGGARCAVCYRLRMEHTAQVAREQGFDYFTTTLSISPLKKADVLNTIGEELAARYGVKYLYADFKKKNGYLRSCELSRIYGLYRQDHCGCVFSRKDRSNEHND